MEPTLPEFVPPMLATLGDPFDSSEHVFEIKWDGMRTLAYAHSSGVRLVNRHHHDVSEHFPELAGLGALEPGVIVDGELIVAIDGKPDFAAVMGRRHARGRARFAQLARSQPATFVAFDLLYRRFAPVVDEPLAQRRRHLQQVVQDANEPKLVLSEGIVGQGLALFAQTSARELEGVVGKRLDSPYRPGVRSDAWIKFKRRQTALCAILGFEPSGERDLKSLVIAIDNQGALRCVGQVGSGLGDALRGALNRALRARLRPTPLVPCAVRADCLWVEPGLYCKVSYLERTSNGSLRAPVFEAMIE